MLKIALVFSLVLLGGCGWGKEPTAQIAGPSVVVPKSPQARCDAGRARNLCIVAGVARFDQDDRGLIYWSRWDGRWLVTTPLDSTDWIQVQRDWPECRCKHGVGKGHQRPHPGKGHKTK